MLPVEPRPTLAENHHSKHSAKHALQLLEVRRLRTITTSELVSTARDGGSTRVTRTLGGVLPTWGHGKY